jgi:hypothetical protein
MKKAVFALCVLVLLFGSQMVSARTDVQIIDLHTLDTQDPTECGPEAPSSVESVGRVILRFNPSTPPPVEHVVLLQGGLPNSAYSFYTVRHTSSDPCDYIIWSSYPLLTDKNGRLRFTGTLGTIVKPGDRLAMVLVSPPSQDFDPGSGPYEQVVQSEFFTVP